MGRCYGYKFKAYIFTNGRSTFDYSLKSLQNQADEMPYEIVKDRPLAEAMNDIFFNTDATHILKVDDDFFLHPFATMYMINRVKKYRKKPAFWYWTLWEEYTSRAVQCIKIYDVKKVRVLGGFKPSKIGQIDRNFKKRVQKSEYSIWRDPSLLALHACAPWHENLKYEEIWTKNSVAQHMKDKTRRKGMRRYTKSVPRQYKNFVAVLNNQNTRRKTAFWKWLKQRGRV